MQRLLFRCYCTGRQSYYEILGLPKTATTAEIKKAFITLSKKYHPDLTGSNEAATRKFVAVKKAYDTLKDADKREDYDNQIFGDFSSSSYGYSIQSNSYQNKDFERIWRDQYRQKIWKEYFKAEEKKKEQSQKVWDDEYVKARKADYVAFKQALLRLLIFAGITAQLILELRASRKKKLDKNSQQ